MSVVVSCLWAAPAGAGVELVCTYDAGSNTVSVDVPDVVAAVSIGRVGDEIRVNDTIDCEGATRFNTDTIVVTDSNSHTVEAAIDLSGGELRPGATDEPGRSDEIEMVFRLGVGRGQNTFAVHGLRGRADHIRVGESTGDAPFARRLNLNAAERTGIDVDVVVPGALSGMVLGGFGGRDHLTGDGGDGTGAAYAGKLSLLGHADADDLEGGRVGNEIHGGRGPDRLVGWKGGDTLFGEKGNDVVLGRRGWDELFGGDGDDVLGGGHGTDACDGGPGDNTLTGCE